MARNWSALPKLTSCSFCGATVTSMRAPGGRRQGFWLSVQAVTSVRFSLSAKMVSLRCAARTSGALRPPWGQTGVQTIACAAASKIGPPAEKE